jgi:hypothetical protein
MLRITRISEEDQISISEKYHIDVRDIEYWLSLSFSI